MSLEDMVKQERLLVAMGDQHFPHIDKRAEQITLQYVRNNRNKIDTLVFLGDSVDNPKMSEFPARADNDSLLQDEIDQFVKHVDKYHQLVPKAEIYVLAGNHCVGRFERVKGLNANLSSLRMLTFEKALQESVKEQGFKYSINFGNYFKLGSTVFTHGDPRIDPRLKGGANGAKRTADTYPDYDCDIVMGHQHRVIQEPRPKSHFSRNNTSVYVVGAMFDVAKVEKHYTSFNAYQNGFLIVRTGNGYKQITNIEIKRDQPLYVDGKRYR
jgi:predicted phosphodiesterase